MPKAYFYIGVSADDQTADQQRDELLRYYRDHLAATHAMNEDSCFVDIGVSGSVPFCHRPAGMKVHALLAKRDALVVTRLDRAFRSTRDFVSSVERWTEYGVAFHLLAPAIDTSTPTGKATLAVMSAVAEFERAQVSVRTKEKLAALRRRGLVTNGTPPYGFLKKRVNGEYRLVRDDDVRALMRRLVTWADAGWTDEQLYWHLKKHGVTRRDGSTYSLSALKRMIVAERRLQAEEARRSDFVATA